MAAGGTGHGPQHQLSPGMLCPGWGHPCLAGSAPLMLFGLLLYFFCDMANLLDFLEGKLYFHVEMASALHGKS